MDFLPDTEPERCVWLSNYAEKLPVYGPMCGISEEEVAATIAEIKEYIWLNQVPEFCVTVEKDEAGFRMNIDFDKQGHTGVWIESRVNGGKWAFLAIHVDGPYLDKTPLESGRSPEIREYRMRWWDKREAHGEWSLVQKVELAS